MPARLLGAAAANRLLILSLCSALLPACSLLAPNFDKPDLSVVGVELLGGNLLQQNFRVTLKIHNPNDRALPVDGVTAHLAVGGEPMADGSTDRSFVVPAQGDAQVEVTVAANMAQGILKIAKYLGAHAGPVAYELTGVVRLDLPWYRKLPFHESGSFSLSN